MANIICSTVGCGAVLGDLCEEVVALFNMKAKLSDKEEQDGQSRALGTQIRC